MEKLLEFQKRVTPILKDSANPFFKSKYFDINSLLETIRPILNDLELALSQPVEVRFAGDKIYNVLATRIYETSKEDRTCLVSSEMCLPENPDPQKMGAAITYFRRYALQSMLCLEAEDDDGNTASGKTAPATRPAYTVPASNPVVAPAKPAPAPTTPHAQEMQQGKQQAQNTLGTCQDCGAPMTIYKTSGKTGCSKLCWKNPKPELPVIQQDDYVPFQDDEDRIENITF